ncbi:response regulator [Candidatus Magnetominusculus xianensis]|uniref:Histidine kinase n=1 Tax=Candidatus Magnetominusculus xianensis TaxID=1748249 RepID=A0ABR5SEG5_9BACT|nr:response regulator [Candidatus Magnetominusculus xianensis]KWT84201.1 histidine kinase [Candidatus Magnetominusculus xianensis]MBF0405432.1 response regulator [Nitrospirota bacterium]
MSSKGRVLVVDDQPINVKLLDTILTRLGFEVLKAYSGQEALDIVHDTIADIILLDMMMPVMDGLETCRQLKADPLTSNIPVLFISALTDVSDKVNAFTYGGVDYITKPFQKDEVVSRVESHLRIYRLQKSLDEKNARLQQNQTELTTLNQLLATYNDKLEVMVRARTQELNDANKQLTASLKEKEILIKELHHRVRNNLQIISSMLNLGLSNITNPEFAAIFKSSYSRVKAITILHDNISESSDFTSVNIEDFINVLFGELVSTYGTRPIPSLTIDTNMDSLSINLMITCGLVLNELISNSLRHAFAKDIKGSITITFNKTEQGDFALTVSDNGKGFSEGIQSPSTYGGLQVVKDLVQSKLKGRTVISFGMNSGINSGVGTTVTITFKDAGGRYQNVV